MITQIRIILEDKPQIQFPYLSVHTDQLDDLKMSTSTTGVEDKSNQEIADKWVKEWDTDIGEYGESDYLFEAFQEQFASWTRDEFKALSTAISKRMFRCLKKKGVWLHRKEPKVTYGELLFKLSEEEIPRLDH